MRILLCILSLTFLFACSKKRKMENPVYDFQPGAKLAKLTGKKLSEVSDLAASITNAGYLWAHNDSGNEAQIFLINQNIDVVLTCTLAGIENRDWEDITVGPGPDPSKNYVYVGEIGDNDAHYKYKHIYRFEEPVMQEQKEITITAFDTITFQLPGKKKDTEALMVDPNTKDLYVVSKREEPVHVYRLTYPYSAGDTLTAEEVASLPLTQIVAADFSADGKRILMKNYEHIYYWNNTAGKSVVELLKEKPKEIPYTMEPQGEAITWARDGSGFYTLSEKNAGYDSYLYFYKQK